MKKLFHNPPPDPAFVARAKTVFLAALREKFPPALAAQTPRWMYFVRGLASGVAVMLIVSGVSVYADQGSVGPESFLYPIKRSQETVRLLLAAESEKPSLHLAYAQRRLDEIDAIRQADPRSEAIPALAEDFRNELAGSIPAMNTDDDGGGAVIGAKAAPAVLRATSSGNESPAAAAFVASRTEERSAQKDAMSEKSSETSEKKSRKNQSLCHAFQDVLEGPPESVVAALEEHPDFFEKFEKKCASFMNEVEISALREKQGPNSLRLKDEGGGEESESRRGFRGEDGER